MNLELTRLGGALEQAASEQLAAAARRPRRSRRLVLAVAVAAVTVATGVAVAAVKLTSPDQVAASMPAGTLALAGTEPTCTIVTAGVEYHCLLAKAPAPEVSDWKGTVEPTVDTSKHVNGGCRSLTSDGLVWECYLGQTAVDQKIIGAGFLGQYAPGPGVG